MTAALFSSIPRYALDVLQRLNAAGYPAYFVGGCVRDMLLGRIPSDYDITTAALPEQVSALFPRVIATGLQHGTLTVLTENVPIEVTTYRLESAYSDCRHPDQVEFTTSLHADLARRDFTINAMAYHPAEGLIDYFSGQQDLNAGILRCVGDAAMRMQEDALRILRALRFSTTLGFSIAVPTQQAAHRHRMLLKHVSAERISTEFCKLLCGQNVAQVLLSFFDILGVFLPELLPLQGFLQHNPHHSYDVLTHIAKTVAAAEPQITLRLAALFHDIAKPQCFQLDANGVGHFYEHAKYGADLTSQVLHRLHIDHATLDSVVRLVRWHDTPIVPTSRAVKRAMNKMTPPLFFQLLELQRADRSAQHDAPADLAAIDQAKTIAADILQNNVCFDRKTLAVNGNDLLQAGFTPGKPIGAALALLVNAVIDGQVENTKGQLLDYLKSQTDMSV